MFVTLPHIRLHYVEEGEGPPLVWLPGGNDSAALMLHVHRSLAARARLICYDPRGQGRSDTRHTADDYAPANHVTDLLGFLNALELERVVMGGHSRGGRTSMEFALTHPDRIVGVIAAASPLLGFTPERAPRFHRYQDVLATEGVDPFLEMLGTGPRHPDRRALWREAAHHAGAAALIAQYEALGRLPPLPPRLATLAVPSLFLCGDADSLLPHTEAAAAAAPHSHLSIIPGARHALFNDNPTAYFGAINRFLDQLLM